MARLVLACAPYACAPYIGADTGAPDSTEIFRDIVGLLGLPRGGREGGGVDFWNSGEGSFKGL